MILLVTLGGALLLLVGSIKFIDLLDAFGPPVRIICFLLLLVGGAFGLYRLVRKVGGEPVMVIIAPGQLTVLNHKTGNEKQAPFNNIAAYRYQNFNNVEELRLKLKDGSRLKLAINTMFQDGQNFTGMVQAFEAALGRHQAEHGETVGTLCEKTFFEKPISTVVMVGLTAVVAELTYSVFTNEKPVKWGSLMLVYSSCATYAAAWLVASRQRW